MAVGPNRGPFRGPQPTRRRLIQSATVAAAAAVALDWLSPLSTPPAHLVEPGLGAAWTQYHSGVTVPAEVVNTGWLQPLAEPVRAKPQINRGPSFATDTQPVVFFLQPLAEPVRVKASAVREQPLASIKNLVAPLGPLGQFTWLSEPVRVKPQINLAPSYVADTKPPTAPYIPPGLSEPVRVKRGLPAALQQAIFKSVTPWCLSNEIWNSADKSATISLRDNNLTATKVSSDGNNANARGTISRSVGKVYFEATIFQLLNEDVGVGIANSSQPLDGVGATNYIGDASGNGFGFYWGTAGSKIYINNVGTTFFTAVGTDNIGIAIDFDAERVWVRQNGGSWFGAGGLGGDPVAGTNGLSFAGLNAGPWFPATSMGRVGELATIQTYPPYVYALPSGFGNWQDGDPAPWYAQLSEPVRVEPGLGAAWQQYHSGITVPAAVTAAVTYVPGPLSEPVKLASGLSAPWMQVSSVGAAVDAEDSYNWFIPLNEPVRSKPRAAWYQPFTTDTKFILFTDLRNGWFRPFSEPVRAKKAVPWQQFLTIDWKYTAPAFLAWYEPFSEPVRQKQRTAWHQFFATDPTTPAAFNDLRNYWFGALSEPVRVKPTVAWQQPFTTDWQWNVIVRLEWLNPLSEPVQSKKAVAWQQFFTTDPTTPASITDLRVYWYRPLAEPVRVKAAVAWQQFFTTDPTTPAAVTDLRNYWFNPLAEPVRSKQRAAWYQPFTTDWKWQPPSLVGAWFKWLAEPVRTKPRATWFQPYTMDWRWSPPTSNLVGGWHKWLSEPVRQRPSLHASRQQFFTMDWKWSAPPIINITYSLNATESGDLGALLFDGMSQLDITSVIITEIRVGNLAQVTITALKGE